MGSQRFHGFTCAKRGPLAVEETNAQMRDASDFVSKGPRMGLE